MAKITRLEIPSAQVLGWEILSTTKGRQLWWVALSFIHSGHTVPVGGLSPRSACNLVLQGNWKPSYLLPQSRPEPGGMAALPLSVVLPRPLSPGSLSVLVPEN